MRLLSWNVNGIRAIYKRGDLDWLWQSDTDVICIQETKAHKEQLPQALLDQIAQAGFVAHWSSGQKKGYSGVATFVREGVPGEPIGTGFGDEERFDVEGRIQITDHEAFVLLNIYFPNGGQGPERVAYKAAFNAAFERYVLALVDAGRDVVVCGDLNIAHQPIDLAQHERFEGVSGFLPQERAFLTGFLEKGFIDTFRAEHPDRTGAYTFWDYKTNARADNLGWRIDYFLINERLEDFMVDAWISSHILGSDHCPVGLELEFDFE